jgi:hypothetical protein
MENDKKSNFLIKFFVPRQIGWLHLHLVSKLVLVQLFWRLTQCIIKKSNLSSFHKKKNLNFLVHSWSKIHNSCQILLKFHRIFHPTSVIRRPNCYWSNFYPKKNPILLYKNISLCVGWWSGNLYTTNFFNLEINVNLVSYQNLWTFLLFLSISMHFDSVLLFVQILCIYAVFISTYGTSILGIWKFCVNILRLWSFMVQLWSIFVCSFTRKLGVKLSIFVKNGCQPCWVCQPENWCQAIPFG